MGIQGLQKFMAARAPDAYRRLNIKIFSGHLVAVDAPLWLYAAYSNVYSNLASHIMTDEEVLATPPFDVPRVRELVTADIERRVLDFICMFYRNNITPIFVFDGASIPEKDSGARVKRSKARADMRARFDEIRREVLDVADDVFRPEASMRALRGVLKYNPPMFKYDGVKRFLRDELGVSVVNAPDEAEKFCAFLSREGIAAASWSADSDSYVFGARVVIRGLHSRLYRTHFQTVFADVVKRELGVTHEQFRDIAIMFGCDFNKRVPGIGPEKVWGLVAKVLDETPDACRLIEHVAAIRPGEPWECLAAERCREIFSDFTECLRVFELNRAAITRRHAQENIANPAARNASMQGSLSVMSASEILDQGTQHLYTLTSRV